MEAIFPAAGLSTKSPFSQPFHRRIHAYMSKLYWSQNAFSECFALINLDRVFRILLEQIEIALLQLTLLIIVVDLDKEIPAQRLPYG